MIKHPDEIANPGDREAYIKCREILDNWFINVIEEHKTKNHPMHECFNDDLDEFKEALKGRLDGTIKFDEDTGDEKDTELAITVWINHNHEQLMNFFMSLICLFERRKN